MGIKPANKTREQLLNSAKDNQELIVRRFRRKDLDGVRYQTGEAVPACPGNPSTDKSFEGAHAILEGEVNGNPSFFHATPEELKKYLEYSTPSVDLLRAIQFFNDDYRYVPKEALKPYGLEDSTINNVPKARQLAEEKGLELKEEQLSMCRDKEGRIWLYEENKKEKARKSALEEQCDKLRNHFPLNDVTLTEEESFTLNGIFNLLDGDYCFGEATTEDGTQKRVYTIQKVLSGSFLSDTGIPDILDSEKNGGMQPRRAREIAASVKKAFSDQINAERRQRKAEFNQDLMPWLIGVGTVASPFIAVMVSHRLQNKKPKKVLPTLRDMVEEMKVKIKRGEVFLFDPMLDKEIVQMAETLGKDTYGHVAILSEPGVGKTFRLEAIAYCIAMKELMSGAPLPKALKNASMYFIDPQKDVLARAGSQYRSMVEQTFKSILEEAESESTSSTARVMEKINQRIKAILPEVLEEVLIEKIGEAKQAGKKTVILAIDEFHTIMNLGKTEGSAGIHNMLKSLLARESGVHLIVCTTEKEWAQFVAADPELATKLGVRIEGGDAPLASRFGLHAVETPNAEEALATMLRTRNQLEKKFRKTISPETLAEVVRIADSMKSQNFMRKATKLLGDVVAYLNETKKDTGGTITPEHVREYAERTFGARLRRLAEDYAQSLDEPGQAEIKNMQEESLRKILKNRIEGFDTWDSTRQKTVIDYFHEMWNRAEPEVQAMCTPPNTSRYAIPEDFFDKTGDFIADAEAKNGRAFRILPKGTVVLDPSAGPKGGGTGPSSSGTPPEAGGSTGGTTGESGGAGPKTNGHKGLARSILRETKGFAFASAPAVGFAALEVAAHKDVGLISEEQHGAVSAGLLTTLTAFNPYTLTHMAATLPQFLLGQQLTAAAADATGVKSLKNGSAGNLGLSVAGGFAASEAVAWAIGRQTLAQAPTIFEGMSAHRVGTEIIHRSVKSLQDSAVSAVGSAIRDARIATSLYKDQIFTAARTVAQTGTQIAQTARQAGAQTVQAAGQVAQQVRQAMPQAAPAAAGMAAGALAFLKTAGSGAVAAAASTAAVTGVAIVATGAVSYGTTYYVANKTGLHDWIADNIFGAKGWDKLPESKVPMPRQKTETRQELFAEAGKSGKIKA